MKHSSLFKHYWWAALVSLLFLAMSCASAPSAQAPSAPQSQAAVASSSGALPAPQQAAAQPGVAAPKSDIWPKIYDDETYLTTFDSSWSEGEAVGAIKNLQNAMVEFTAGIPFSELDVDPYGLRAKWSWTEGSFIKSANLIIPFDQVSYLLLEHYPMLNKEYKWGLLVGIANAESGIDPDADARCSRTPWQSNPRACQSSWCKGEPSERSFRSLVEPIKRSAGSGSRYSAVRGYHHFVGFQREPCRKSRLFSSGYHHQS